MRKEKRNVMTVDEAEDEVGRRFEELADAFTPVVLCPHKVWIKPGLYRPIELEAIACLTRFYGDEPDLCDACDEDARGHEEQPKKRGRKEKRRNADDE